MKKALINLLWMITLSALFFYCSKKQDKAGTYNDRTDNIISNHQIFVDGKVSDWEKIPAVTVQDEDHLWFGEGLPEGQWKGPEDLSFSWKTAWNNNKLYFLFEVQDDTLSGFDQEFAWLNDCIEIYVDPQNSGGSRIEGIGSENNLEDRIGKNMRGYEMQFLPSQPPRVYVDDSKGVYYTGAEQNDIFKEQWNGEIVSKQTSNGYLMEIGFTVPDADFQSENKLGLDVAVCDDDGEGRKSLLLWSAYKGEFWLTMDNFHEMSIKRAIPTEDEYLKKRQRLDSF